MHASALLHEHGQIDRRPIQGHGRPLDTAFLLASFLAPTAHGLGAETPSTRSLTAPRQKTYRNPLLGGQQMADPDVIRVNGKYYLYATTHTKGYDVFVSEDLIHWKNKGRAFDDPRGGAWAPDVFQNQRGDGKFYLYYTDNSTNNAGAGMHKQVGVAIA